MLKSVLSNLNTKELIFAGIAQQSITETTSYEITFSSPNSPSVIFATQVSNYEIWKEKGEHL